MDYLERMAWDLENAQTARYNAAEHLTEEEFWADPDEMCIYKVIQTFFEKSRTFNPDNER